MRINFLAPFGLLLLTAPALADPSPVELDTASAACRDAFLTRDTEAYLDAAASMIAWGAVEDPEMAREVELCLAFAEVMEGADLEESAARAAATPESEVADAEPEVPAADEGRLAEYLARAQAEDADMAALTAEIAADESFAPAPGADRDAL